MYHQHKKAHTSRKTRTETSLVRIVHVSSAYVTVLCYCAEQYCNSSLGTHTHKCTQRSQQLWSQLYTQLYRCYGRHADKYKTRLPFLQHAGSLAPSVAMYARYFIYTLTTLHLSS